jgi:hypothetical protein
MAGHLFFNQFGFCQISYCRDAILPWRAEQDLIFRITNGVADQRPYGIRASVREDRSGLIFRIMNGVMEQRPYGDRASAMESRKGLVFRITNGVTEQRPCGDRASSCQGEQRAKDGSHTAIDITELKPIGK